MEKDFIWLLQSDPWVEYHTRLHMLQQSEQDNDVITARERMVQSAAVQNLVAEVSNWPGTALVSHKSAGHSIHKLTFLADLGLKADDTGMERVINEVMSHQDPEGPYQTMTNFPVRFGGSGKDDWGWVLCDAPLLLYALIRFGLKDEPGVKKGVEKLTSLVRENGWPCAACSKFSGFRGPGRKEDPCPYANLIMLKVLGAIPELNDCEASRLGAESILTCWAKRETYHPYIFYMGTDFSKLKAPLVWYDILNVTSVLTQFEWLRSDERLNDMIKIIASKADDEGRFTAESVWLAWKEWEFGQKKKPSAWITYLAHRVMSYA